MVHTDRGTKIAYCASYCPLRLDFPAWEGCMSGGGSTRTSRAPYIREAHLSMRTRSLTTWAYTFSLLCVLAPAPSFTDSLGDAASAEERRRAARESSSSPTAKSSSRGSGKAAGVSVSEPSATTSTASNERGSTRDATSDPARSSKPASPSGPDAPRVGRSASGHGGGSAAGVAATSMRRVYNNQALLELRDRSLSRGTFSQATDGESSSDPTSSTSGGASSSSSSQSSSTSSSTSTSASTPSAPSSPGPVPPREPTTTPTPAPSKPTATPTPAPTPTPAAPSRGDGLAAIPELSRWKTQMLTYGQKACTTQASAAMTDDERLGSTYYDATRVYEQIADFTGQSGWEDCAEKAKAIYRGYVLRNQGNVPGYWNFTTGFRMDWERNADALSKQAGILLSQHAAYCRDD